jgi:hypothetical protein
MQHLPAAVVYSLGKAQKLVQEASSEQRCVQYATGSENSSACASKPSSQPSTTAGATGSGVATSGYRFVAISAIGPGMHGLLALCVQSDRNTTTFFPNEAGTVTAECTTRLTHQPMRCTVPLVV